MNYLRHNRWSYLSDSVIKMKFWEISHPFEYNDFYWLIVIPKKLNFNDGLGKLKAEDPPARKESASKTQYVHPHIKFVPWYEMLWEFHEYVIAARMDVNKNGSQ